MMKKINKITVLGDGGWGTTLAILLSQKGYEVRLWGAFAGYVRQLNKTRINAKFLPGIRIPSRILITADIACAARDANIIVLAVPSQYFRNVLKQYRSQSKLNKCIYASVTKGIEIGSLRRMSEVIHQELGPVPCAVLSGPTIAHEVAYGVPSAAVVASRDERVARKLQDVFMTEAFRIYINDDVTGVEIGGSLKNIIAIACGVSDGLVFGANTKAAILSRGLTEISRLGLAMGAKLNTFSGLSGLGDLVTTCISSFSRNRSVGEQIGKGKTLQEVLAHMQMVAEGIPTTKSVFELSKKYGVYMPITKEVYAVLYQGKSARKAVKDLMTRAKKAE